jgi:hypothetical protein
MRKEKGWGEGDRILLQELNLDLLVRCVLIPSRLEARKEFL